MDARTAREVVVVTSGVLFRSRDGRAGRMGAHAAIGEGAERGA